MLPMCQFSIEKISYLLSHFAHQKPIQNPPSKLASRQVLQIKTEIWLQFSRTLKHVVKLKKNMFKYFSQQEWFEQLGPVLVLLYSCTALKYMRDYRSSHTHISKGQIMPQADLECLSYLAPSTIYSASNSKAPTKYTPLKLSPHQLSQCCFPSFSSSQN